MKNNSFCFLLRALCISASLFPGFSLFSAAGQPFKGKVIATDGTPLEGVIISTSQAGSVVTEADGSFSLPSPSEEKEKSIGSVKVAFDGYYTRELRASSLPETIVLVPLSERRYTGETILPSGSVIRSHTSAIVESVSKKDFADSPSAILSLQDVSSGMEVSRKSGMPGEGGYFNIRGIHTIHAENTPLIVINGVPYLANTSVSDVVNAYSRDVLFGYNAHDIRRVTLLKGAEAAMYGSLGSNGVISIETEQATSDNLNTRISLSGSQGLSFAARQIPVMGVDDFQDYLMNVGQTRYSSLASLQRDYPFLQIGANSDSYLFNNQTNWNSLIYDKAFVTNNVLRVEGGDEVAKYNISFGYSSEGGVLKNTNTDRYHTSMNSNIMVSPDFEIFTSVNLAYLNSNLNNTGTAFEVSPVLSAYAMMPNLHPYEKLSDGGIINRYLKYNGWNVNSKPVYAYDNVSNPLAIVNTVDASDKIYDANIRLGFNWHLGRKWTLSSLVNLYYDYTEEYVFTPGVTDAAIIPQLYGTGENFVAMGVIRQMAYCYNVNAAYRNIFDDVHSLHAFWGARYMTKSYEYDASSGYNSAGDYYRTLSMVADEWNIFGNNDDWKLLSFYAHSDYVYDNLLKASVGLSIDGTSASGVDAPRFGCFPSVSFTFMGANTPGLVDAFDVFNVTGELSLTGNSRFSSNYAKNYYVSNNLFNLGTIVRSGVPNTSLEWEKKFQADLGTDVATTGNRIGFRMNVFFAHHYDLLLDSRISSVYGSNEAYYSNTASINNLGGELSLRFNPIHTHDIDWVLTASVAHVSSTLTNLGDSDEFIQTYTAYDNDDAQTRLKVGRSPYEFYGYKTAGVYATTAEAQAPTAATGAALRNTYGKEYQDGRYHPSVTAGGVSAPRK